MEDQQFTPIGVTNYRNTNQKFGIKDADRLRHIYCIGKTGVGKSTLLKGMAFSDITRGHGCCIIDPHGDIAEEITSKIPENRRKDIIYLNPSEPENAIHFNPLHAVHPSHHHLVASGIVSTFHKVWNDSWGPRLEYILRNAILTLLWYPQATLLSIQPLLTDIRFRNDILNYVKDDHLLAFWHNEFEKYSPSFRNEVIASILNKSGIFISSIPLRRVVGEQTTSFRMQKILNEGKILIVNLSKGKIGEEACTILGSMIISAIHLAAMYRATQAEHTRRPFYLYIDEMHSFITLSFADILSEARKYGLGIFLTHQYISQLDERIQKAIFGNVGTMISFRIGAEDANVIAKEFFPTFDEQDLVNLPVYTMYLKLMIDGTASQPFSATSVRTI